MGRHRTSPLDAARGHALGAQLRSKRQATGSSQEQVARDAGVATATLRKIENGDVANPGFFTVLSLAAVLDLPVMELVAALQANRGPTGDDRSENV